MELIKIGELAKRSGVPIATLKHYLREGLIRPSRKTGRTMAYYDAALATRVRAIKDLQRDQFLPLDVIRKTVDRAAAAPDDLAAAEAIAAVLERHAGRRSRTRDELIARGVSPQELDWLAAAGFARPDAVDQRYRGDDLAVLATLGAARKAGITPAMLPFAILGEYLVALRALVEVELRMFRAGVLTQAARSDVRPLTDAATQLSERLVVLLRRKLLLPTLHDLIEEHHAPSHKPRAPRTPGARSTRRVRRT
ncbi:MAG: MerR family transcriptional regulator [Deltaproteobacteria bacterium]|nr:MerR family transcriptional regulator [Deltaproteobacteria bacterium]